MWTNPLRSGHRMRRSPEPASMVIFGGSGDLTRRKLIPALYRLSQRRMIPAGFTVIGLARSPMDDDNYREMLRAWVEKDSASSPDPESWTTFSEGIHYLFDFCFSHLNYLFAIEGYSRTWTIYCPVW